MSSDSTVRICLQAVSLGLIINITLTSLSFAQTWAGLGNGTNGQVRALAYDGLLVYVGGSFTEVDGGTAASNIAAYNPLTATWLPLLGGVNGVVNAIAVHPSTGDVYIGGSFSGANGADATNIVAWTGVAFQTLGTDPNEGINGEVRALAFNSSGDLFVGGTLGSTNEDTPIADVRDIAMWDGSVWSVLGADPNFGVGNSVNAIAIGTDDTVYVGGTFVDVANGTVEACRVAKYFNDTWYPVGGGVNGVVHALAFALDGDLYVGGEFGQAADALNGDNCALSTEGFTTNNLATWNTVFGYEPVLDLAGIGDNGVNNDVLALLAEPSGDVIVAGQFTDAGACGTPCEDTDRIALWQPLVNAWVPIGSGFGNNQAQALAFAPSVTLPKAGRSAIDVNILVAGGSFTMDGDANPLAQVAQLQIVLPVELTSFEAFVHGSDVLLTWSTASETSNAGFEIQHRPGGDDVSGWKAIDFVAGAGTTEEPLEYRYEIASPGPGLHRFRLKQVDFDGAVSFSPVLEVMMDVPGTHILTGAYPNPFNPQSSFELTVSRDQQVRVELFDATGRLVQTIHDGPLSSNVIHRFGVQGDGLSGGAYVYRVTGETFVESRGLVLVK